MEAFVLFLTLHVNVRSGLLLWKKMKRQSNIECIKYWIHATHGLGLDFSICYLTLDFEEIGTERQKVKWPSTAPHE